MWRTLISHSGMHVPDCQSDQLMADSCAASCFLRFVWKLNSFAGHNHRPWQRAVASGLAPSAVQALFRQVSLRQ